ncbi:MAG: hypothetical protein AB1736_00070 [Chloroflexota bacterium]
MTQWKDDMTRRQRPRRTDPDIVGVIERLALEGWNAAQTLRHLEASVDYADRAPSLRTVQDIARRVTPRNQGERWAFDTSDPDDAGPVLDALAAVIERTGGLVPRLTTEEAAWVARIAAARRGSSEDRPIPPITAWECARLYVARRQFGQPTDSLDAFLAFAPWRDGGARYAAAFASGYLHPLAPVTLAGYHQVPIRVGEPPSRPMWIDQGEQS